MNIHRLNLFALRQREWRCGLGVLVALLCLSRAGAQTVSISGPSWTGAWSGTSTSYIWNPLFSVGSNLMTDPIQDQQTGQGGDDMVGSSTVPGFMMKTGTISNAYTDSTGAVLQFVSFRIRENVYSNSNGNSQKLRLGIDGDMDGQVDLFFGINFTGSSTNATLGFQSADGTSTTSNTSPSTTDIGDSFTPTFSSGATPTLSTTQVNGFMTATGSITFNYQAVTATNSPGATTMFDGKDPGDTDGYASFAMPFLMLAAAYNNVTGGTISLSSFIRLIAFTATQDNAINQDLFGVDKATLADGTATFASSGAFSDFINFYGVPIPEPATYAQLGVFALVGLGLYCRRSRNLRRMNPPASPPLATDPPRSG
jgi:hypothetical protein